MGVLPEQSSTLWIYLNQPVNGPQWKISFLIAKGEDKRFASRATTVKTPPNHDDPYKIPDLLAGKYSVSLYRSDNLTYQLPVEINASEINTEMIIDLPVCNCNLNVLSSVDMKLLTLYSEDQSVKMMLAPFEDGLFHFKNLPPGSYNIADGIYVNTSLATFDLIAGEDKTVDITQFVPDTAGMGMLQVEIVDENGSPIIGCGVWIENSSGKIKPTMQYDFQTIFMASAGNYTIHTNQTGYRDVSKPMLLEAIDTEGGIAPKAQKLLLRLMPVKQ